MAPRLGESASTWRFVGKSTGASRETRERQAISKYQITVEIMAFDPLLSMRGMVIRDFFREWDKVVPDQY